MKEANRALEKALFASETGALSDYKEGVLVLEKGMIALETGALLLHSLEEDTRAVAEGVVASEKGVFALETRSCRIIMRTCVR